MLSQQNCLNCQLYEKCGIYSNKFKRIEYIKWKTRLIFILKTMIKIRIKYLNSSSKQHIFPFDPIRKYLSLNILLKVFWYILLYIILYKCNTDTKLQTDSQKKDHFYCQDFGFIYINLCFSHKISYFFEISKVNVHISIKVFVSDKINLVKITTVKESSTFRTSYFSHQVVFQVMLCPCIFLTGKYHCMCSRHTALLSNIYLSVYILHQTIQQLYKIYNYLHT